mmetsp:Transcript_145587/g.378633  ORF Transcript_145587/g.378633 Transcript_145587/m.378633 type:complete len:256 (+) Transcript_145587:225-992(+)
MIHSPIHVAGAQEDLWEVVEEFLLLEPKDAILGLERFQGLLHVRVIVPTLTIIIPLPTTELSMTPRITDLDHVETVLTNISADIQDGVGMTINDAVRVIRVRAVLGAATHDKVGLLPRDHPRKQLRTCQLLVLTSTTTDIRPIHGPQIDLLGTMVEVVCQLDPLSSIAVQESKALEAAFAIVLDVVHRLAPCQRHEPLNDSTSDDICPTTGMLGHGFFDVGSPQVTLNAGHATHETTCVWIRAQTLVNHHIHLRP